MPLVVEAARRCKPASSLKPTRSNQPEFQPAKGDIVFVELMPLLSSRTVMITVAREDERTLRVNVIPTTKSGSTENPALATPLSYTGSPDELDAELGSDQKKSCRRSIRHDVDVFEHLSCGLLLASGDLFKDFLDETIVDFLVGLFAGLNLCRRR
jgi:PRTRC genetic system protein E